MTNRELIDELNKSKSLTFADWKVLMETFSDEDRTYAAEIARDIALQRFENKIYFSRHY